MQDYESCENAIKNYVIGAQILHKLGIEEIELLSSHTHKEFVALKGFGLDIVAYKSDYGI